MKAAKLGLHSIENIELFVRIVERESLTAAGASLGMSTSLVSRHLASLERALGVRLIDRSSRLLVLTEQGREFHAHAVGLLQHIRDIETALRAKGEELRGTLRVSLPNAAAETEFMRDIVALFHRHANLCIDVTLSDRPVDIVALGLDVAIYLTDAPDRHPGDVIIGQHPTALAAAPAYLDRAGRPGSPQELATHRTIRAVSRRGTATTWTLTHVDGRKAVVDPGGSMILSDELRVLYATTINGAGIGRMPVGYIAKAAMAGGLEIVLPEWRFRPIMVAATLRRQGAQSAKIAAIIELIQAMVQRVEVYALASPLKNLYLQQMAPATPLSPATAEADARTDQLADE